MEPPRKVVFPGHGCFPSVSVWFVPQTSVFLWSVLPVYQAAFPNSTRTAQRKVASVCLDLAHWVTGRDFRRYSAVVEKLKKVIHGNHARLFPGCPVPKVYAPQTVSIELVSFQCEILFSRQFWKCLASSPIPPRFRTLKTTASSQVTAL